MIRFKTLDTTDTIKEIVISLREIDNDVDILANGILVAYFDGSDGSLTRMTLSDRSAQDLITAGIRLDDNRRIA